jgi:hypothetical protein
MHVSIIKRLFSLDSVLVLLIVIVGFIGAFGFPQKIGITNEQLVLGLLAAFGLELLVQRVGKLATIGDTLDHVMSDVAETKVTLEEIGSTLRPTLSADSLFLRRSDPPAFDTIVANAHEMWVAGKSLNSLLAGNGSIIVSSGVRFRFLIHDPAVPHITQSLASQSFANPSVDDIEHGIEAGLGQLHRLVESSEGRIEARLSSALIPNGFTIVNPGQSDEWMRVELFSYQVSLGSRRSLCLHRVREPDIYAFYYEQFSKLWAAGKPLPVRTRIAQEQVSSTPSTPADEQS